MGLSGEQFVKDLADSGLIAAEELKHVQQRLLETAGQQDRDVLAQLLIRENLLTEYQAEAVLRGEADTLILGNYVLLDRLGEGGMGRVYKAWHRRMKRIVALKTLPEELATDERANERFHREVETAARLTHRNIVTAYDADQVDEVHFLVMEYVEGRDLATIVRDEGPLSVGAAIQAILDAARGLEYAHQQGIVHRDIKPSNLLLDSRGMVKVLDLGLARPQRFLNDVNFPKDPLTASGAVVGTVDYLAPEQAINTRRADHRADVYSLGVTLFFLLTGRVPFSGETVMERVIAHREQPVPSLRDFCPAAPQSLESILVRMLAKNPADRFPSMSAVIEALETCLRALPRDVAGVRASNEGSGDSHETTVTLDRVSPRSSFPDEPRVSAAPTVDEAPASFPSPTIMIASLILMAAIGALAIAWSPFGGSVPDPTFGTLRSPERQLMSEEQFMRLFPRAPERATARMSSSEAAEVQRAWADYLGVPLEMSNSIGMRLRLVPPGDFIMGSSLKELEALTEEAQTHALPAWYVALIPTEGPQRRISLYSPLYVGAYEVTQQEYEAVLNVNPSRFRLSKDAPPSAALPVETVTWYDAIRFCNALSIQEGLRPCYEVEGALVHFVPGDGYRLPTEAEWEYFCRAGTQTRRYLPDDHEMYQDPLRDVTQQTQPVGQAEPNAWGLYDLYGNVWEWCEDEYLTHHPAASAEAGIATESADKIRRITRGASHRWPAAIHRSAQRTDYYATYGNDSHGLRVVREVRRQKPK